MVASVLEESLSIRRQSRAWLVYQHLSAPGDLAQSKIPYLSGLWRPELFIITI